MSALAVGIVGAPMKMHPVLELLLKAFILLVFGGIAAFCVVSGFQSSNSGPVVPAEALARCLTCGEATPNDAVCPVCAEPPQQRAAAFNVQSESLFGPTVVTVILAGVGCLGLFIMIGPYLDGERRWWALIAFAALGLLMLTIGAVGVFGFVLTLRDTFRGAKGISFTCQGPDRNTVGKGKVAWRKLVWLEGHGQVTAPLVAQGRSEGGYRFSPGDMALAEMIATFDAAGIIDLGMVTTYDWCLGDSSRKTRVGQLEFVRTTKRLVMIMLHGSMRILTESDDDGEDELETTEQVPSDPQSIEFNIRRFLSRYLNPALDIVAFKAKLDADPIHRTQAEMHARVLRDRGIVPANELVEAALEALVRE